jgi:hypothetical protein
MVSEVHMFRFIATIIMLGMFGAHSQAGAVGVSAEMDLDQRLNATVANYSISGENLLQALARVSDDFHLRMGIEWEVSSTPYHSVMLKYDKVTPLQVIKDLVGLEPSYVFSAANGVVHVRRSTIYDDRRNFLNLHIDRFDVSHEYVFHASNRLYQLVFKQTNLSPAAVEDPRAGCAGSFAVGAGDQITSFHVTGVTVRDVLDKLVVSAGYNMWLVTFAELKNTTPNGFFKTLALDGSDLPDDSGPMWYLLVPGHDPVRKGFGIGWPRGTWEPVGAAAKQSLAQ